MNNTQDISNQEKAINKILGEVTVCADSVKLCPECENQVFEAKAQLKTLITQAVVEARVEEVYRIAYEIGNSKSEKYVADRLATLQKGME